MYPFKNNIPAIRNVVIMNKYLFTKGIFKNYEHFKLEFEEMGIYKYNIIISSLIDPTKSIGVSENDLNIFIIRILRKLEGKNQIYLKNIYNLAVIMHLYIIN